MKNTAANSTGTAKLSKQELAYQLIRGRIEQGASLAESLRANVEGNAEERLSQIAGLMRGLGYESSAIDGPDGTEIEAHNCVFHDLAFADQAICGVDLALLRSLSGQEVEHRRCMAQGGRSCRFAFKPPAEGDGSAT